MYFIRKMKFNPSRQNSKMKLDATQSTSYRIVNFDDDLHLIPNDDLFEHLQDVNCPCIPFQDKTNEIEISQGLADKVLWVHRRIKGNKELM